MGVRKHFIAGWIEFIPLPSPALSAANISIEQAAHCCIPPNAAFAPAY